MTTSGGRGLRVLVFGASLRRLEAADALVVCPQGASGAVGGDPAAILRRAEEGPPTKDAVQPPEPDPVAGAESIFLRETGNRAHIAAECVWSGPCVANSSHKGGLRSP